VYLEPGKGETGGGRRNGLYQRPGTGPDHNAAFREWRKIRIRHMWENGRKFYNKTDRTIQGRKKGGDMFKQRSSPGRANGSSSKKIEVG